MIKKIIAVCFLIFAMALQGAVLAESGPNGAGPDVRDPMYYEKTDKVFLGTWECTSDPHSTLTIKEANPQTGGYYVDFFFYRLAHADGYANISGDKLSINQGSVNDDQDFRGIFEKTQTGIRFTVTESGFNYLKPGEQFEYKKMSGKPAVAAENRRWRIRTFSENGPCAAGLMRESYVTNSPRIITGSRIPPSGWAQIQSQKRMKTAY